MLRILKISLLVSVVVLLNAMTTLLFVQNAVPASAGPQCVNGDVNGDAAVDITDPIHLLSYIFEGGPEPVACAQSPAEVIVLNSPDVNVVNVPTVELQGSPTVRIEGMLNPENATSIIVPTAGTTPVSVLEVPAGFRFFLTDINYMAGEPGNHNFIIANQDNDLYAALATGRAVANAPEPSNGAISLRAPIVFEAGEVVLLRLVGNSGGRIFTIGGFLESSN